MLLVTHHHLDHTGLVATIARRSGAIVAALDLAADYGAGYVERSAADRRFSHSLMRRHGVPDSVIADNEWFWEYINQSSRGLSTDVRLAGGDQVRAGGTTTQGAGAAGTQHDRHAPRGRARRPRLRRRSPPRRRLSNTEIYPAAEADATRPRSREAYLRNLRRTARMPLPTGC